MATPRSQRIGILVIAIVMIAGTLGSFLVMGLSINNQKIDEEQYVKENQQLLEQQKLVAQLNADNSEALVGYETRIFDPESVTKLNVEVLTEGTGEAVKATDSINASYFGWSSNGIIFDSSKKKNTEDTPATFPLNQVIQGWTEGLTGIKVGSVVRLTIPPEKAYGTYGSGIITANSPLEFIVQIHKIDNSAQ